MNSESKIQEEKVLQAKSGFVMLICGMLLTLVAGTVRIKGNQSQGSAGSGIVW